MLSFIIPVHNPDYAVFKRCLKSLKDQSLRDWEAVIVFDGYDEQAKIIAETVQIKNLTIIDKNHEGVQQARNYGAKHAKGEYLCFWDCDCLIEPEASGVWIDTFKKQPDIGFIYSGYKFLDEKGAISSEPFDPWLLNCGNYISTCFPMRKELFPGFDEALKSLHDWDLWLTIVKRGGKGMFIPGFAFSTAYPTPENISGKNCTADVWLDRVKAVKIKHGIPDRKVCVSSLGYKHEGIKLAKTLNADYKDVPNYKPNTYDTIIQVGFSLHPNHVIQHAGIFNQPNLRKKIIFWTHGDVCEINNFIAHKALTMYAERLNVQCVMFVEDLSAKKVMESAGFIVKVMQMPLVNTDEISKLPDSPRILVDITEEYRQVMACLEHSLPDMKFDFMTSDKQIKDYSAILALNTEQTMSFPVKRMLVTGRNVISNIQSPFCGFVNDRQEVGKYITSLVNEIRKRVRKDTTQSTKYWADEHKTDKLMEVLK